MRGTVNGMQNFWLWINSGVRQWRGHGVATGALFGVPSDIFIWPHFHSQATVAFVLAGVCCGCVNLMISDRVDRGIQLTFKGGGGGEEGAYEIFEK